MEEYIQQFENVIDEKFCKELIGFFESNEDHQFWGMTQPETVKFEKKKTKELVLDPQNPAAYKLLYDLQISLLENLGKYQEKHEMVRLPLTPSQFRIKKYDNDGSSHFDWHVDSNTIANSGRALVALWYLNDVAIGGETEFKNPDMTIKPSEGTLVMFPPFWTFKHRANPPVSNPKYIVSTFLLLMN